jgi:hypothetical protein
MTANPTKIARAVSKPAQATPVVNAKRPRTKRSEITPAARMIAAAATTPQLRSSKATPQLAALEPAMPVRVTRCDQIFAMLNGANGTSIAELMSATGWLPHAARSALSGLRKAGMLLERTNEDGGSRYRIKVAA